MAILSISECYRAAADAARATADACRKLAKIAPDDAHRERMLASAADAEERAAHWDRRALDDTIIDYSQAKAG